MIKGIWVMIKGCWVMIKDHWVTPKETAFTRMKVTTEERRDWRSTEICMNPMCLIPTSDISFIIWFHHCLLVVLGSQWILPLGWQNPNFPIQMVFLILGPFHTFSEYLSYFNFPCSRDLPPSLPLRYPANLSSSSKVTIVYLFALPRPLGLFPGYLKIFL